MKALSPILKFLAFNCLNKCLRELNSKGKKVKNILLRKLKLVVFDFDETLIDAITVRELIKSAKVENKRVPILERYRRGELYN